MSASDLAIVWNNFVWWIADQKYQAPAGRYYTWYNVDTRRFDVQPKQLNKLLRTYSANITCVFNQWPVWDDYNIIWTDDWKIYYDNETTSTLKATLSLWKQWQKIGYMRVWTDYKLYYFHDTIPSITPKYIHRSDVDWNTLTENYATYDSTDWSWTPPNWMQLLNDWDRIIFSHYNNLFQIETDWTVTKLVVFKSWENIVWITQFQWQYKIYTTIGFIGSKVYTWDWITEAVDILLDLQWLAITSVVNDWAYDYMVAWWSMYQVAWSQYLKLYDWIWWNLLKKIKDDIYYEFSTRNSQIVLWVFWDKPWYPKSITPLHIINNTTKANQILLQDNIAYNENAIYYATADRLYKITATWTAEATTSYIESLVFIGDNIRFEKEIDLIDFHFSWTSADCTIKLEAQLNENWTWLTIWSWKNWDISTTNHWLIISKNMFTQNLWVFNTIRLRVSFLSNWIQTCKFYWVILYGKQNIWK